jgi:hypothetical protein
MRVSRPVQQRFAAMRAGGGCGRLVVDFFIPRLIIGSRPVIASSSHTGDDQARLVGNDDKLGAVAGA